VRGLAVPDSSVFETPLGKVALDRAAIDALADLPQVVRSERVHANEHALEVQLPFLQAVLDSFALVPIAVGDARDGEVDAVIERLWGGDETLVVVSTDLSHYLPDAHARATDAATIARILRLDDSIGHDAACGATPLDAALRVARRHGLVPELLDARNSGDASGDRDRVVGYASLAFRAAPARADLGAALVGRARNAIASTLDLPDRAPEPWHPALSGPGATFVTLRRRGALRGCIGRIEPEPGRSLDDDVRRNARGAAFEDPRFPPLDEREWDGLDVEVSLLGPVEPIRAGDEDAAIAALRPGEDGVILEWRGRRATFLPQVWEQLPDAREFLTALRAKAGLSGDDWQPDLSIGRYRVEKFGADGART
jgi:AmmeMemoRadiSam system protein A